MKLGPIDISRPVFLAPLSGITDSVFRILAKEHGAGLVFTEMISADGLARGNAGTQRLLEFQECERPIGVQLFGSHPETMARAAALATDAGPDLIDLNFGCPARRVVRRNGGAALLKDLDLLQRILRAVVRCTDLPVTAKIRSGWEECSPVAEDVASICEASGIVAITVHPRSRQAGFSGRADWSLIGRVKERVKIPVIGNGDIRTPQDGLRMFGQTGCDAIMVGRGALGNPWLFQHIVAMREGHDGVMQPSLNQRIALCLRHAHLLVTARGEFPGLRQMRKHFAWYTRGFAGGAALRAILVRLERLEDVEEVFRDYQKALAGDSLHFPSLAGKAKQLQPR